MSNGRSKTLRGQPGAQIPGTYTEAYFLTVCTATVRTSFNHEIQQGIQ